MNTLFAGSNSHVLRVDRVRDKDDSTIADATVSATLYEYDGKTPVAGFTWPITLTHILDGLYEGVFHTNVEIAAGRLYVLKVVAEKGSTRAEWKGSIPSQERGLDD